MSAPQISIVMPVYNGQRHLVDAVASIVEQSFSDWELLCVDDGSTDRTPELLDWLTEQDDRVRVLRQANTGIVGALNRGCHEARAGLICRMDCDDIALPHRLAAQKRFLDRNPDCVVVGGSILEMDADGHALGLAQLPTKHADIENNLLRRKTGHFHPTTLFRTEAFHAAGDYRREYQWVEDHDLWLRMSRQGRLANLQDCVLCYRQHAGSVCWQRSDQQRLLMNDLLAEAYQERDLELPRELIAEKTCQRSQAGPGKWARAAARGGFTKNTMKHLGRLWASDARLTYKSRMSAEATLRLAPGLTRRILTGRKLDVPQFPTWQRHAIAFMHALEKQCPQLKSA